MDVLAALRSLDLSREDDVPDLPWLTASYEAPAPFWAALAEHARRVAPVPASRPGEAYDLYRDAVGRHAATARVAFTAFDRRAGWRSVSYAELAARASACAQAWAARRDRARHRRRRRHAPRRPLAHRVRRGPPPRPRLLLPRPRGRASAPPAPRTPLAPARVVFDPASPPPIGPWAAKALALVSDGPPHALPPHAYAPKEPCALLFSPLRAPLLAPVPLTAEIAWQNALRDAVFAYRLAAGESLALPGFPPQQHHPAALFAALIAGATFVHLPAGDLAARPALLQDQPIGVLGVTPALRDVLRAGTPCKVAGLGRSG